MSELDEFFHRAEVQNSMSDRIEENKRKAYEACPYVIGDSYIIRTVTMYYTGRLESVYPGELVLSDAAWIADTGRWSTALSTGKLSEVEPYPGLCIVSRAAIVDVAPWTHPLPRDVR